MKQISSRDNPHYKELLRLAGSSRARRGEGTILLEGVHLVQAYASRFGTSSLRMFIKHTARQHSEIAPLAEIGAPVMLLDDNLFDRAAPVRSPVGILALADRPQVMPRPYDMGFRVLLDGVQDPGNVGAILRSAAACGANAAYLSSDCADPWSPKTLRAGMGAQFIVPITQSEDLSATAAALGVPLFACVATGGTSIFHADLHGPAGFLIGGEGAGVKPPLLRQARQLLSIPMTDGIESLNAASAATVIFYEWLRQRDDAGDTK
jgi:RNA methyltransferase, TrmH family